MDRDLFIFFQKRIAHRIYPDPTDLICLVSRFFHDFVSGQWVFFHYMFLFPLQNYLVSNGVHMGSNQVLPAFFANLSSLRIRDCHRLLNVLLHRLQDRPVFRDSPQLHVRDVLSGPLPDHRQIVSGSLVETKRGLIILLDK